MLHHLTRIARGLGGENLVRLSGEELARFGVGEDEVDEGAENEDGKGLKRRRNSHEEVAQWASTTTTTIAGADEQNEGAGEGEDPEIYAQNQQPMKGEIGARSLAAVVSQNGAPPAITHVEDDDVTYTDTQNLDVGGGAGGAGVDKAARRAAKKQMRSGERRERALLKTVGTGTAA